MRLHPLLPSLALLLAHLPIDAEPFSFGKGDSTKVVVNNRILANVNGKSISVIDLMKKMDLLFYREYAEYASIPQARQQFYQANWKHVLNEIIEKELIMADAEEIKIPMSAGDVRQEMERLFGPNIITNLDKIGMTFDEAQEIVKGDLLIQRMLFVRVNSKAMRNVTPLDVRNAYEEFAKTNILPPEWIYQVISIRDKDSTSGAETANLAHHLITDEKIPLNELAAKIKESSAIKTSQVTISEELKNNEKELSPAYKEALQQLTSNSYSMPSAQTSRSDKSTVFRIFYLKEYLPGGAPPFAQVQSQIKDALLEKSIIAESTAYLNKLRRHFDVQEMVPDDFQPFVLK
jgi:hypothetical protein